MRRNLQYALVGAASLVFCAAAGQSHGLEFRHLMNIGTPGVGEGQFRYVEDFAFSKDGKLLVTGTANEVIAYSRLVTWIASGDVDLFSLAAELRSLPGVEMVVPFGNTLHVSGTDEAALDKSLAPYRERPGITWQRAEPSLEDVFIKLMERVPDNVDR